MVNSINNVLSIDHASQIVQGLIWYYSSVKPWALGSWTRCKGRRRNICVLSLGHNPEMVLKTLHKPVCDVRGIMIGITKNCVDMPESWWPSGGLQWDKEALLVSVQMDWEKWIRMQTSCHKPVMIWDTDQRLSLPWHFRTTEVPSWVPRRNTK